MKNPSNNRLPGIPAKVSKTAFKPAKTENSILPDRIRAVADRIRQFFGENEAATARRLNTVTATVKTYTDGKRFPATEMCIRMHEASGLSLNWLLLGKGPELVVANDNQIFSEEEFERISNLAKSQNRTVNEMIRILALAQLDAVDRLLE